MSFIRALISLSGRALLVAIFLASALGNHIPNFNDLTEFVRKEGIPEPKLAHIGAISFMLIGGISVLLGFWARFGALLLAVFLGLASYYIHDFWKIEDPDLRKDQMIHFMKNVALLGAMLMIIANGPGAGAIDKRKVTIEV